MRGRLRTLACTLALLLLGAAGAEEPSEKFTLYVVATEAKQSVWVLGVRPSELGPPGVLNDLTMDRAGWRRLRLNAGDTILVRTIEITATDRDVIVAGKSLADARTAVVTSRDEIVLRAFIRDFD